MGVVLHGTIFIVDEELLPIVSAGKDVMITLPERTAIMNGSLSHDGFGIVSYQWTRSDDSPAAGGWGYFNTCIHVLCVVDAINYCECGLIVIHLNLYASSGHL